MDVRLEKQALRDAALNARSLLSAGERAEASRAVGMRVAEFASHLEHLRALQRPWVMLSYAAHGHELDPSPSVDALTAMLASRGVPAPVVLYPRVCGPRELSLHACGVAELAPGYRGILEPPATTPQHDASSIDMVLVPGVAFGRDLMRLGYGKGFYDGLLATTDAVKVGLTFSETLSDVVPHEPHDHPLDAIVSPSEIITR